MKQINWKRVRRVFAEVLYPCPVCSVSREHPKEKYYNNKYPKKDVTYAGRFVPNTKNNISIDVRDFFHAYDSEVMKIVKGLKISRLSDDEKVLKCLLWVVDNIKYVSDTKKGRKDYWQFCFETLHYRTGDCEDGSVLLANLMLQAGVPYWKIRISVGEVKGGAHGYVNYYCQLKNKWVILDWCYDINRGKISQRKDYKDEQNYFKVWFSWNLKYAFTKGLNEKAKKLLKGG